MNPGKPMMPMITKTYTFPKKSKIRSIECSFSDEISKMIDYKIETVSEPITKVKLEKPIFYNRNNKIDDFSNNNFDIYPKKRYDYQIKRGIDGISVSFRFYPYKYQSETNTLFSVENVKVNIEFEESKQARTFSEEYDMVIIAPNKFSRSLSALVEHKNEFGLKTFLKTTEKIYDEYNGRDKPEQIKYFIKDAIEQYNISYVLLVGGRKGIKKEWYVPVRYSNLDDLSMYRNHVVWEKSYLTDLYYADIYRYNELSQTVEFDDWDSNKNDIFAEWTFEYDGSFFPPIDKQDIIDGDPDVYIGRLACRNKKEVNNVIRKIINYESSSHSDSWSKRMVVIAGDCSDESRIYISWNISNLKAGEYTIFAQCHNGEESSSVESIKVYLSKNQYNEENSIDLDNSDLNKLESSTSFTDPIIRILNPYNGQSVNEKGINIILKAYDLTPPFNELIINVWIKNEEGIEVKNYTRYNNYYYFYEGEILTSQTSSYMKDAGYNITRLYTSTGTFRKPSDIIKEMRKGVCFMHFHGHGDPSSWGTHFPNEGSVFVNGLLISNVPFILNNKKFPVVVMGGCHNNQFDVTPLNIIDGIKELGFDYFSIINYGEFWWKTWIRECLGWKLVSTKLGGSIATIGNTGLGWTYADNNVDSGLGGWIESKLFEIHAAHPEYSLGKIHSQAISNYIANFSINEYNYNEYLDRKTVEEWVLFGDPSLKIGGYPHN